MVMSVHTSTNRWKVPTRATAEELKNAVTIHLCWASTPATRRPPKTSWDLCASSSAGLDVQQQSQCRAQAKCSRTYQAKDSKDLQAAHLVWLAAGAAITTESLYPVSHSPA